MATSDTICAISTPVGAGGIGIVRLSGSDSVRIADRIVRCSDGVLLADGPSHKLRFGKVYDIAGNLLDEALISVMRAPRSYTREDIVEINCHGGVMSLAAVLDTVMSAGARLAEPGEFTRRAFLNGRIDLTRAAAVTDIIAARTPESHRAAAVRLSGRFHNEVTALRDTLLDARAALDASIDFPEDDLPDDVENLYRTATLNTLNAVESLIKSADRGRLLREGATVAITGRPNVGKSSLFNAILKTARAIVTPVPGTTRDLIEETVNIGGIPTVLMDGAGLRDGLDMPERVGIDAAWSAVRDATVVLFVLDASEPVAEEDRRIVDELVETKKKTVLVVNKTDLPRRLPQNDIEDIGKRLCSTENHVEICAKDATNIDAVETALARVFLKGGATQESPSYVTRVYEKHALEDAQTALHRAVQGIQTGAPADQISADMQDAADALGIIIGAVTTEDILDRVFSDFCIGK
ncbi:MAG: tRNA uridine-5-carboxymethylaminomethyl(34) synthesis GTPase MnmE [Candidatus Hydrogenedentes bacterium]|nr:tRNA uridine-5-carboxymethylaminomethyl(34) synthesis GTPase MnmE [Candidatus Hydrogenedentota bacterium]